MNTTSIKERLTANMQNAMRKQEMPRLEVLRLILAAFKQIEVDERVVVDDARALIILDKMLKERRDSITQFKAGNREDLVAKETYQESVIKEFLPPPLSQADLQKIIMDAITAVNADNIKHMAQVIALVKPQVQGRADLAEISKLIKNKLAS